ncbi:Uncharacterised protein [Clostridium carnis]|uniref:Uncharacterized protein n=1 Tax=Clostridium carnis TaxID=1530 RepID=A0ABY6SU90_9CLOT|nr:hypothetical protein [Clostridium carnis]VDG72156.1 Uncharacterised protein [Clostridium carnis]
MEKYTDLIMGLISGIVLMFLNNDIVNDSVGSILTLFNPINTNKVTLFLVCWGARIITIISFIGVIITITSSFLILKKIIIKK